jgi:phosphatidylserine/phosphatidylglycerophosphate/cardiolipin synthase-like enzyme
MTFMLFHRRWKLSLILTLVLLLVAGLITGIVSPLAHAFPSPVSRSQTPNLRVLFDNAHAGGQTVSVFVEPAAGEQVILEAINNAQRAVWLEMYLLTDQNIIKALENAAGRGLDVRVMLEPHPVGGGSPQSTINALNAAGAKAQDTNTTFALTHEKGIPIW